MELWPAGGQRFFGDDLWRTRSSSQLNNVDEAIANAHALSACLQGEEKGSEADDDDDEEFEEAQKAEPLSRRRTPRLLDTTHTSNLKVRWLSAEKIRSMGSAGKEAEGLQLGRRGR